MSLNWKVFLELLPSSPRFLGRCSLNHFLSAYVLHWLSATHYVAFGAPAEIIHGTDEPTYITLHLFTFGNQTSSP